MIRPSSWLPLGVLGMLVALTWWLDQLVQPGGPRGDASKRHDPDLIVENFSARKFGEDGKTLYTLAARKMVHYPDDDSAMLERLGFEAYEPRQPRVRIASDRGRLLEGGDKVWFEGNVVLVREADGKYEASRLTTDRLLVLPDSGVARTSGPVLLVNPSARVEASGLELLAVRKAGAAGLEVKGAVAASDAFFPFPDGVLELAKSGITAVVQPGGSIRDDEVIAAANEAGLAMVFTGRRHFRHL